MVEEDDLKEQNIVEVDPVLDQLQEKGRQLSPSVTQWGQEPCLSFIVVVGAARSP